MRLLLVLLLIVVLPCAADAVTIATGDTGEVVLIEGTQPFSTISCGVFGPDWSRASQEDARGVTDTVSTPARRALSGTLRVPDTRTRVTISESVVGADPRRLEVAYQFAADEAALPHGLCISVFLPCDRYAGRQIALLDARGQTLASLALPGSLGEPRLLNREGVAKIAVDPGSPLGYEIALSPAASVLVQDGREWEESDFEIRIDVPGEAGPPAAPGRAGFSQALSLTFARDVTLKLDPASAVSRTDTSTWFPYTIPWDAAPVDLSWLNERPAGGHGFLTVKDGRLVFEDGTTARFWGTCVTAAANFPTHEQSEVIARRMAQFGINIVRTHHADAGWSTPNFFDESAGDTQHLDPDALDRFDYFIACLRKNGIYVYLDQLVHRKFTAGDGVANAGELDYAAKPYTLFDPTLVALQQKFSRDLLTHVNPYTGLAYKDDPAIALIDLTNENDLFVYDVEVEPYATSFEQKWREWARARSLDADQPVRTAYGRAPDVLHFVDEVQRGYYAEMHASLRGLGVRVPITGNTWLGPSGNLPSQFTMDFLDSHAYWDHPYDDSRFHNRPQVKADIPKSGNNFATLAVSRALGKPFVCSEWGHPWPNEWRAEGPLATAAVAALQGWDGLVAYTYRHSAEVPVEEITGPFNTFNDPAVFGLFPAAALMFRRGDVAPSAPPTIVLWEDSDVFARARLTAWNSPPAYRSLVERTAVATALAPVASPRPVVGPRDSIPPSGPTFIVSDTGQLRRDWKAGVGAISSPASQAAYGFLGDAGTIALPEVTLSIATPFAVVAVSSLDGAPIATSRHLLVTAVGRVENTGMAYNLTRTRLKEGGEGPILVEPITGQVAIRTRANAFQVFAIAPDGTRSALGLLGKGDGGLALKLDPSARTIYYELVAT